MIIFISEEQVYGWDENGEFAYVDIDGELFTLRYDEFIITINGGKR